MEIRDATEEDLPRIMELGREFGHQMLYQKDEALMKGFLPETVVAEIDGILVGYYHYLVVSTSEHLEMLRHYKRLSEKIIYEAWVETGIKHRKLLVCMQGASHREVFRELIRYIMDTEQPDEVWCYCSLNSRRPQSYEELGFVFQLEEQHRFWNPNKGDYSTYRLGRWKRPRSITVRKY